MTSIRTELNCLGNLSNLPLLDPQKRQLIPTKEDSLHRVTQLASGRERVAQISFSQVVYEST